MSRGKSAEVHDGTLFLDESGNMPPALQARLLRVLQDQCIARLGTTKAAACPVQVRARGVSIIAASFWPDRNAR